MPFQREGLGRVAHAGGFTIWTYKDIDADGLAAIATTDYFLGSIKEINLGDKIFVPEYAAELMVNLNDGINIDTTDATAQADSA